MTGKGGIFKQINDFPIVERIALILLRVICTLLEEL